MTKPAKPVSLKIARKKKTGYTEATSTTGKIYWYQFTGGTEGNGNQWLLADNEKQTFEIKIRKGKNFQLVDFWKDDEEDPDEQLQGALDGNSVKVDDECSETTDDMSYGVIIKDAKDSASIFICDPMIRNEPPQL